jgi:hypothetical protein
LRVAIGRRGHGQKTVVDGLFALSVLAFFGQGPPSAPGEHVVTRQGGRSAQSLNPTPASGMGVKPYPYLVLNTEY